MSRLVLYSVSRFKTIKARVFDVCVLFGYNNRGCVLNTSEAQLVEQKLVESLRNVFD